MALVLHHSGLQDLQIAQPWVAQAFIDHGAVLHKVYVIGSQVAVHRRLD